MVIVMPLMILNLGGDVNDVYGDCDGDRMVMSSDDDDGFDHKKVMDGANHQDYDGKGYGDNDDILIVMAVEMIRDHKGSGILLMQVQSQPLRLSKLSSNHFVMDFISPIQGSAYNNLERKLFHSYR